MSYKYSFDPTTLGDVLYRKSTFRFFRDGMDRLLERLNSWNAAEEVPPYDDEVRDLSRLVNSASARLSEGRSNEDDEIYFSGMSVGTLRYFKAGALLRVLEAEERLQREQKSLPSGVIAKRREWIADMKRMSELGPFASVDPADCLWEVAPSPSRTPAVPPAGESQWDVFISHASEDKEPFVRELAERLHGSGVRVWYDVFELKWGDSLRRSIERGVRLSRFGIVVLSPRFFAKHWPQLELDGMATLEVDGRKVILPIWHDVDREGVTAHSPILAGRLAVTSADGVDTIAERVRAMLEEPSQ